jgi:hypothetical protein
LRSWATAKGLLASPADYVDRTPQRRTLRFSRSGHSGIEAWYRTHWISPELNQAKRERLAEKVSRAPELVVVQPLKTEWTCHRRGGAGDLLMMESAGPACLRCVGLDDLACKAYAACEGKQCPICHRRAFQQSQRPLRTTGSLGRAASAIGLPVIAPRRRVADRIATRVHECCVGAQRDCTAISIT